MTALERQSPCKVNLILNIVGKRSDGFHELETLMQPVPLADDLRVEISGTGISLTCNRADLPLGRENLVYRATEAFLEAAGISDGVKVHLEKRVPLAAGLGGGSSNAATALGLLNDLYGCPLDVDRVRHLAAALGSDVPFFLQTRPALATGRGEIIEPLPVFPALKGAWILLVHPGFGVSTAWAYKTLAQYPEALNGQPGRAAALARQLSEATLAEAGTAFYNALEAPVFPKYPLLELFRDFFHANGAAAALMSGSGSTVFAITHSQAATEHMAEKFRANFGGDYWSAVLALT